MNDPRVTNSIESTTLLQDLNELDELRKRLKVVEDRIFRKQAALSSARKLPLELLGRIFRDAVDVNGSYEYAQTLTNLVLVCKTWRDAAFATGRLWTTVQVVLPNEEVTNSAAVWLHRARGLPTSLEVCRRSGYKDTVCGFCTSNPIRCEVFSPVLINTLKDGPALSKLKLTSPTCLRNLLFGAESGAFGPAPWNSLKLLEVYFDLNDRYRVLKAADPTPQTFLYLPPVASFIINLHYGREPNLGPKSLKLPLQIPSTTLNALTTFSITCCWMGPQVLQVLQHCQNLENLALDIFDSHQTWNIGDPDIDVPMLSNPGYITLPKVRDFSIAYTCSRTALRLLRWLRMPRLEALKVNWQRPPMHVMWYQQPS